MDCHLKIVPDCRDSRHLSRAPSTDSCGRTQLPNAGGVELCGVHVADVKCRGGPKFAEEGEGGPAHRTLVQRRPSQNAGETCAHQSH